MKNSGSKQILVIIFTITILNSALSGCEKQNDTIEPLSNEPDQTAAQSSIKSQLELIPGEELSKEERDGLIFLREEEKLARDVYNYLHGLYNLNVFANIPKSEQQHMDAIKFLLDRYEIKDPAEGMADGVFTNMELQQLYNNLILKGKESGIEALKVGALIEEVDIRDLMNELEESVDNKDIKLVYDNLIKGSKNHLKAFTGVLKTYGINYAPVILDEKSYNDIVL